VTGLLFCLYTLAKQFDSSPFVVADLLDGEVGLGRREVARLAEFGVLLDGVPQGMTAARKSLAWISPLASR
jgi:hypothetical protein